MRRSSSTGPNDQKLHHLRRVPLVARTGAREIERIGELADEVTVGMDQVLAEQGHHGDEFFIVLDGRLTVLDRRRPISELGPGDFFGEIALLDGHRRTATVRADGITRLLLIGHRELNALMDELASIREAVLLAVEDRVARSQGIAAT